MKGNAHLQEEIIAKEFKKNHLLQKQLAKFNQTSYNLSFNERNSSLYLFKKDQVLFKGEVITNIGWGHIKIFFSSTTEPKELIFT
jgi:hypothetical protein